MLTTTNQATVMIYCKPYVSMYFHCKGLVWTIDIREVMFCRNNEVTKYIKREAVLGAFVPFGSPSTP